MAAEATEEDIIHLTIFLASIISAIILVAGIVSWIRTFFKNLIDYVTQSWSWSSNINGAAELTSDSVPISSPSSVTSPSKAIYTPESAFEHFADEPDYEDDFGVISSTSRWAIKIAVDATPTRGGGLLVLPMQQLVFFYSVEWKDLFDFEDNPGPDKFELVNAMLALRLFRKYVTPYRNSYCGGGDALILKGDNSIFGSPETAYSQQKNVKWQWQLKYFYEDLRNEPWNGDCVLVTKKEDGYLNLADRLSRGEYADCNRLPEIVFKGNTITSPLPQYIHINISDQQHEMFPYLIQLHSRLPYLGFPTAYEVSFDTNKDSIWIFTSASPSRCGGILALPKQGLTYFYSMDWSGYYEFGKEPEVIQLVNALLAIHIFQDYVKPFRKFYKDDGLLFLAEGSFCMLPDRAFSGRRRTTWRKLYCLVRRKLKNEPFLGNWDWHSSYIKHGYKGYGLMLVDRLCKSDYSTYSDLPRRNFNPEKFFMGNTETNISLSCASRMEKLFKIIKISVDVAEASPCYR